MLYSKVVLNLVIIWSWFLEGDSNENLIPFNEKLITSLRNDANLDLPVDEEYEDLRAELLAYHTALATLSDTASRRSMKTTECWKLGGVCINYKLCEGYRYITEVPGCKDKLKVCCFAWNQFHIRDWSKNGIYNVAFPWGHPQVFGEGKGVLDVDKKGPQRKKLKTKKRSRLNESPKVFSEVEIQDEGKKKLEFDNSKEPEKIKSNINNVMLDELLPIVSSKVEIQEESDVPSLNIYKLALPVKDPDEFEKKASVEIEAEVPQVRKKRKMTEAINSQERRKESIAKNSILRSLRSRFPYLMVSLEIE